MHPEQRHRVWTLETVSVATARRILKRLMDQSTNGINIMKDENHAMVPNGTTNGDSVTNGASAKRTVESIDRPDISEHKEKQIPVTQILANFVSSATKSSVLTSSVKAKLKEYLIDYIGVTASAANSCESTPSIFKAILALGAIPEGGAGKSTVFTKGQKFLPQYAALLNATFSHSLDFDDTYAEGTLHAGATTISAALTQAELLPSSSFNPESFLIALAVGYEVTCRLGKELGFAAYSQGMHNTSTAGIFGAVATIGVLKGLPSNIIDNAFGLAGSKAAGSMQYLDNGSWNKRLHPGFAVHDAFLCVSLAETGVIGASRIIEGNLGFLHAYSPNQSKDLSRLVRDLGSEWIFTKTSLKPFPACRMTHGLIEMGAAEHDAGISGISKITVSLPPPNIPVVGSRIPNKLHPKNSVDAQFSAYFQTAYALLYGSSHDVNSIYSAARFDDPRIIGLCDKMDVVPDDKLMDFASALEIEFENHGDSNSVRGQSAESKQGNKKMEILHPLGEEQHPFTRDKVEEKFMSLMTPVYGKEKAGEVMELVDHIEDLKNIGQMLELLR